MEIARFFNPTDGEILMRSRRHHPQKRNQPNPQGRPPLKSALTIGTVDVPFNWIFVMIAGGAILFGAFAFVQKQRSAFAQDLADTVLRDLGAITSGASVAKGTSQVIDIPESTITLSCTDECNCGLSIPPVTTGLKDNILYGQNIIKGTKIVMWSNDWNLPLRSTNLLYVTTPRIKHYILHRASPNDAFAKQFSERIPDNINMTFLTDNTLSPGRITNIGYDAVRFVMLDDRTSGASPTCTVHSSFINADVSCVTIRPDTRTPGITNAYDITIYDKAADRLGFSAKTYRVVGESMAIAAMFADNSHQFECNLRQAYRRLASVALLSASRSQR